MKHKHFTPEDASALRDTLEHMEEYLAYCRVEDFMGREPLPYGAWKQLDTERTYEDDAITE